MYIQYVCTLVIPQKIVQSGDAASPRSALVEPRKCVNAFIHLDISIPAELPMMFQHRLSLSRSPEHQKTNESKE